MSGTGDHNHMKQTLRGGKKVYYFLPLLLLSPLFAAAAVNHTRSLTQSPVPASRIVVTISASDYDQDINCGGLTFWGVQAIARETGNRFFGNPRFVSSTILSQTFTIDVLAGDYEEVTFICSDNGENEAFQFGSIEHDVEIATDPNPSATPVHAEEAATSTPGIIPSIIKGVLDFFGIGPETETSTAVPPETPPAEMPLETSISEPSAPATDPTVESPASARDQEPATTNETVPQETEAAVLGDTQPLEESIAPPESGQAPVEPIPVEADEAHNSVAAALFSLGSNRMLNAIFVAIGALMFLVFMVYRGKLGI